MKKRTIDISAKVTIMIMLAILSSAAAVGIFGYVVYRKDSIKSKAHETLAIARNVGTLVDYSLIREIMGNREVNNYHKRLELQLGKIRAEHNLILVHIYQWNPATGSTTLVEGV